MIKYVVIIASGGRGMNDDEKMFQIGVWSLCVVLFLTVLLQVAFRTQDRQLRSVRNDIVKTQQEIAMKQTKFASLISLENLRNVVSMVLPKTETVNYAKSVDVYELKDRKID